MSLILKTVPQSKIDYIIKVINSCKTAEQLFLVEEWIRGAHFKKLVENREINVAFYRRHMFLVLGGHSESL